MNNHKRIRYVLIGTGNRCEMYLTAILGDHADVAELVALSDTNPGRTEYYLDVIEQTFGEQVDVFDPEILAQYIREQKIDRAIITSPDYTHADLICTCLEAGADVIVEKPLTVDSESTRRIAQAVERTGREVIVTFNYRYSPRNTALKKAIADGLVGEVTSVDFSWMLDTVHGADYFRRWHRLKENSGGLLVHKSSHHFDLVNWWLDDSPSSVYAAGGLKFYGAKNAEDRGIIPSDRGTHANSESEPFDLDLHTDERLEHLYLDNEHFDGYRRDQGVFQGEISIEDNLAVIVQYEDGPVLNYSLNAHSPWEGYSVAVNGTKGRLELNVVERAAVLPASGASPVDPSVSDDAQNSAVRCKGDRLVLQRHWESAVELEIINGKGSHGGGDALLLTELLRGADEDQYSRQAGFRDGVRAIAIGVCANDSLITGTSQRVSEAEFGVDFKRVEKVKL
ncbi:Gfo/Idh/MocA family oxidoreductase [Arthrobacter sp. MYb213]|uniref:Gfo/Idh/MocA family protein n=1 Tax=Arthrobacter sp. MYb213 TaxID=1848595 RepID=UPI000CFB43CE|nr:Gfo/Idh/MocA family oxidoreductase [Arthrobacter sp. MYb213]PRB70077.1 dehydrogenase [Arthrobacter sp. MYb213]